MADLTIAKSLSKAYRQVPVDRHVFDVFKNQLHNYYEQISDINTEEKLKGDLMDFLKLSFYGQNYKVSPNGDIDCAIHLGNSIEAPVGVIIEVKKPTNNTEMITRDNLNRKALQELLLYYLRERYANKNIQLKYLIVTNIYEYFVFDAQEFERLFYSNRKLLQLFDDFSGGKLASDKTDFFYKEIAKDYIDKVLDQVTYTWFDILNYKPFLETGNDKRIIELFKFFSPEHLLKKRSQNDSNSLNTKFYSELLYIIGLEEIEEKDSHKRVITRRKAEERNHASILENTITILDCEDCLDDVKERYSFGKDREEQLFNVALTLTINWINRVLFLKLLEAQLVKYHNGDHSYAFMRPEVIPNYDELNKLFFQVLAKRVVERTGVINEQFGKIPYLNSSLFEVSQLERQTIKISGLDSSELPLFRNTVLKDGQKPRYSKLPTLKYLLEFLDAYDFASEGVEEIQEQAKTLINASVLGLIFEKINGHKDGSVFTPGAVTMYMSREAIQQTVVRRFNEVMGWSCEDYESLKNKDIEDFVQANAIVDSIRICDPAVGSGHFLVSVLNEIIRTKYDLGILIDSFGKRIKKQDYNIEVENDELLVSDVDGYPVSYIPGNPESQRIQETLFNEKRKIIENCLFGVDLNPNAVNICRLRLWIELLKNAYYTKESDYTELETLPNIDINIKVGNSLIHRFNLDESLAEVLRESHLSVAKYKQSIIEYKNAKNKETKRLLSDAIDSIKNSIQETISQNSKIYKDLLKAQIALNELQHPKLFNDGAEISGFDQIQIERYQKTIDKIEKEINDIKFFAQRHNAFEWRLEFPEVWDNDGNFVGFDCVIGNPPYIQLQKMGDDADALQKMNYETYERTGDIYCLFYEMGMRLLKPNASLLFITSNGWMKSAYGKSLRTLLTEKYQPSLLIDFAGYKVFDSATVDVNILSIINSNAHVDTTSCSIKKDEFEIYKLSDYVQTHAVKSKFFTGESWSILSEIERSIKAKIESIGTPLMEWDIQINYGIKTGFNDAFIIDSIKRDEILNYCQSNEERERTAEIIRPILRGRDIGRYSNSWAGLWLIWVPWHFPFHFNNSIQGASQFAEDAFKAAYPTIYEHLSGYKNELSARNKAETGIRYEWYALQRWGANYLDSFSQPKIIWKRVGSIIRFSYDEKGLLGLDSTCFATGKHIPYLCCVLNSSMGHYLLSGAPRTGTGDLLISVQAVEPIKVPIIEDIDNYCIELVERVSHNPSQELYEEIDNLIFDLYGLDHEEREFIVNQFR